MRIAETVDAVYAMARAVSSLHDYYCPGESTICPEMTTASGEELFQRLTARSSYFASVNDGHMVEINTYGDVKPDFEIYNVQITANKTLSNQMVSITCILMILPVYCFEFVGGVVRNQL